MVLKQLQNRYAMEDKAVKQAQAEWAMSRKPQRQSHLGKWHHSETQLQDTIELPDKIGTALEDASQNVRESVVVALGKQSAPGWLT